MKLEQIFYLVYVAREMQNTLGLTILKHFNLPSRIHFWNVNGFDFPLFLPLFSLLLSLFCTQVQEKGRLKIWGFTTLNFTDLKLTIKPPYTHTRVHACTRLQIITCAYKIKTLNEESNIAYFYFCSRMKCIELKKMK